MKDSAYKISLDINEHGSQVVLKAKKADTGRKVYISLRAGGTPYTIEDGCYAVFKATKPDGSILYNACTIENNEIVYEFTEQTCTAIGRSRCEIALYGLDDKLITSPRFALLVDGVIYPDEMVESTDEFSALTELVGDTLKFIDAATEATGKANEATASANVATQNANNATETANQSATAATQAAQSANTATDNANGATDRANEATQAANSAANDATLAAENANETVDDVVHIVKNTMAAGEVAGESVSMDDAVEFGFIGCRIFGKTTQDGVPTPDAPVDLVSIGKSGSITVNVTGENDAKSMTIATPNGLPGIPVSEGGNYTDANGQQWICDEINLVNGTYIKRIDTIVFDGSSDELWKSYSTEDNRSFYIDVSKSALGAYLSICSHFENVDNAWGTGLAHLTGIYSDHKTNVRKYFRPPNKTIMTVEQWIDWLSKNPTTFVYVMSNFEEIALTEEELAAYASLHTYRGNTTVSNDASAHMEISYVIDAKKYMDKLVKTPPAWLTNVTLPASAWEGSDSLYSQVVTIKGITEYSKVDLLPSIEQLAIFFNKNVSFVTENEDGVVTVYAIGDKPTLDYTMQVQITEVEV